MNIGSMKCKEVLKVLYRCGFTLMRQNGSHKVLKNLQTSHSFVVSVNENDTVGRPMLSKILRWAGIEPDQFIANM